jgi:ribosome-binding protein aMBF1 (putative translation factor)
MGATTKIGGGRRTIPRPNSQKTEARSVAPARREPDISTYPGRVAARLRELREKKGWSVKEAADLLGIKSFKTLYSYEDGSREPNLTLIEKVAEVYGFSTVTGWMPPR